MQDFLNRCQEEGGSFSWLLTEECYFDVCSQILKFALEKMIAHILKATQYACPKTVTTIQNSTHVK